LATARSATCAAYPSRPNVLVTPAPEEGAAARGGRAAARATDVARAPDDRGAREIDRVARQDLRDRIESLIRPKRKFLTEIEPPDRGPKLADLLRPAAGGLGVAGALQDTATARAESCSRWAIVPAALRLSERLVAPAALERARPPDSSAASTSPGG